MKPYIVTKYLLLNRKKAELEEDGWQDGMSSKYNNLHRGKVKVVLNEEIELWLYIKEARELSLEEGMELSKEQYDYILHGIIGKRAIKRAMHLLERQDRTTYQLQEKLMRSAYPIEAIEDAISYVKQYHYLDDERYARNFICSYQNKRSRMRLRSDLASRGVAKDLIERCLEEEFCSDESVKIAELLKKKNFSSETADAKEFRRVYQFLARRGFSHSDILSQMQ